MLAEVKYQGFLIDRCGGIVANVGIVIRLCSLAYRGKLIDWDSRIAGVWCWWAGLYFDWWADWAIHPHPGLPPGRGKGRQLEREGIAGVVWICLCGLRRLVREFKQSASKGSASKPRIMDTETFHQSVSAEYASWRLSPLK